MSAETKVRAPRPAWVQSAIITVASLILAFAVGALVMVFTDAEVAGKWAYFFAQPGDALGASWDKISSTFYAMWVGSVGSWVAITNTTAEAAPLIAAGLGVAINVVLDAWRYTKRPTNVYLVVDTSGSMEGEKIRRTREALAASARQRR